MREAFLHYVWKFKKFDFKNLETSCGMPVSISQIGKHNETESGPDFQQAKLKIGDQLWAGNVEIHLKSSDWYAHGHQNDKAYDNVILHVVWEDDVDVFRSDQTQIPSLKLQDYISKKQLNSYLNLFENNKEKWINCENSISEVDDFKISTWLERLYIERLEAKNTLILDFLEQSSNNWDEVCFKMLAKNFGLNINGQSFLQMANSLDFKVVNKLSENQFQLEALFFGMSGILNKNHDDVYFEDLKKEFQFLKQKFQLTSEENIQVKYFRLRPDNFPNIRLSQLAMLYSKKQHLFSKLIQSKTLKNIYEILDVSASNYWDTHYNFGKESKMRPKKLSQNFKDLLIINTLIPLKFAYSKYKGQTNFEEDIYPFISALKSEKNSITKGFSKLKPKISENALESQALIQLKTNYCDLYKCMKCQIGIDLIKL
ncbi:MAG: DUF2851 family protein [Psychroflexus sp.]